MYGPPSGPRSEWQQVADLSQQLLEHLELTGWRDLDPPPQQEQPAGNGSDDGGTLRLRGGGSKRKRPASAAATAAAAPEIFRPEAAFPAAVGQAVEVRPLLGSCFVAAAPLLLPVWPLPLRLLLLPLHWRCLLQQREEAITSFHVAQLHPPLTRGCCR